MDSIILFILTICIAAAGGLAGEKLKLPVGGMLGSMVFVIAFNLIFQKAFIPELFRFILQLAAGAMIGSRISKKDVTGLKQLAFPAAVMIVCMLVLNIIFGIVMFQLSFLDIATTLFATAPGGLTDMAIISADLGADPVYVALLQLSRLMTIFIFMIPFFKNILAKRIASKEPKHKPADGHGPSPADSIPQNPLSKADIAKCLSRTIFCSCLLGLPLWRLGVPAGMIIGSMLGSAAYSVMTGKAYFPVRARLGFQIAAGAFIGMRMDRESFFEMGGIIIPIIIMFFCVVIFTLVTSVAVHKLTGLELPTCLLASTPGGLMEMSLLADGLGANAPKIAVLQTARLMAVIILFPSILAFVARIIG